MIWKIIIIVIVFALALPLAFWIDSAINKTLDDYRQMQQDVKEIKQRLEENNAEVIGNILDNPSLNSSPNGDTTEKAKGEQ